MLELFSSGRIIDLILGLVVAEGFALLLYRRFTGNGIRGLDLLAMLVPGVCLMLALRAALTGLSWPWTASALLASLLAHGVDLSRRWNRAPRAVGR